MPFLYIQVGGSIRKKGGSCELLVGFVDFMVGQETLKVASNKMAKYEKVCLNNQHTFIPFAFDNFGFLTQEVVDLLHRAQRICIAI